MRYIFLLLFLPILTKADNEQTACLLTDSYNNIHPQEICLSAGEQRDFSAEPELNNLISGIIVPEGLDITIYENADFQPPLVTLTSDTNREHLRTLNMENKISGVKVGKTVCLFEYANYLGNKKCLSATEKVAWSEQDYLNDKISSIRIPDGLQATIYGNQENHLPFYTLLEDINTRQLTALNMQNNISSVTVAKTGPIPCDFWCAISEKLIFSFPRVYGNLWENVTNVPHKHIALIFPWTVEQNFDVSLTTWIKIEVRPTKATLINGKNHIEYPLHTGAENFSILFRQNQASGMQQIQFLESNNTGHQNLSPIYEIWQQNNEPEPKLILENHRKFNPLLLERAVFAAGHDPIRQQRQTIGTTACYLSPVLALYNYIVQGHCNQVQRIVSNLEDYLADNNKDTLINVTNTTEPSTSLSVSSQQQANLEQDAEFTLEYLNIRDDIDPLAILSAASTCNVSAETVMSLPNRKHISLPRTARAIFSNNNCLYWTLDTIMFYTLLFGDSSNTWNREHFGHVVDNILRSGTTGYAISEPELENQLIAAVQTQISESSESHQETGIISEELSSLTAANRSR